MGGKAVPTLKRWRPATKLAFVASILLLIAYGSFTMLHSPCMTGQPGLLPPNNDAQARPTLQFAVCNGFTNQRIALLSGLVLAAELKRAVVLPDWLLNGMQKPDAKEVTSDDGGAIPFGEWFDEAAFVHALASQNLQVVRKPKHPPKAISLKDFNSQSNALVAFLTKKRAQRHIRIGCPAFRIPGALMKKHDALVLSASIAMRPSPRFKAVVESYQQKALALSGQAAYNLLHLRVESDWFGLCARWQNVAAGRDNCMNNTDTVGEQLQAHGFDAEVPLILTTSFPDAVAKPLETALASIKRKKYKVVLSSDLVHPGDELSREESALVGYYLALDADKFSGNSVSTLTAMLILERQWLNRFSAHYNGGRIPLATFLPFYV